MARILIALILASGTLFAEPLGSFGKVYPIQEKDFLQEVQERALPPSFADDAKRKCSSYVPKSLGIPRATRWESRIFDPSFILDREIQDHLGRVIYPRGYEVNPLCIAPLHNQILVFDGSDETQLGWALSQSSDSMWVLVGGDPLALEVECSRPVFLYQTGALTRRLSIRAVPVRVSQQGNSLLLEEEVPE
jgi:conjugal transfer pilus assembly protein TraW